MSPALPADGGQGALWHRLYGSLTSVSVPQGSCGYNVPDYCPCVNVWTTDCSVKGFGFSGDLIRCYTSAGHLPFRDQMFPPYMPPMKVKDVQSISDCGGMNFHTSSCKNLL
ncbi:hypothetical protein XENORESO_004300 [Xenotaenia resolanae]|uniref:Uncharacterized protein n=1 Tax=Xenotaenia resolanae TaxID=208358 RepID=A0ABV0W3H8_9TELE